MADLFKRFERRFLRELLPAALACDEVVGLPHGQDNPEIERDADLLALGTGNGFHQVGNIRLSALIEFHVSVDRETVETLLADTLPFTIGLDAARIDKKLAGLADGAADAAQTRLNLLNRRTGHN